MIRLMTFCSLAKKERNGNIPDHLLKSVAMVTGTYISIPEIICFNIY